MIAAYLRVSTKAQATDGKTGLHRQRQGIDSYALEHGITVEQYIEEAFTGTESNRPQFDTMLSTLPAGSTILVAAMDRFTRSTFTGFPLITRLIKQGINLVDCATGEAITDLLQNGNADIKFHIQLSVLLADYNRSKLAETMQKGRDTKSLERGEYIGGPKEKYSPDFRQRLRDKRAQGMSLGEIAKELNAAGERTLSGKLWTPQHVAIAAKEAKYNGTPDTLEPLRKPRRRTVKR